MQKLPHSLRNSRSITKDNIRNLTRHPNFLKLWAGQSISSLGSRLTYLALPLTAVTVLGANAVQMGVLNAIGDVASTLVGLLAGVWVDRYRRRPILIAADLGRGLLVALVPALALFGWLRVEHLFIIAFLNGGLSVLFDIAYRSYLPSLVRQEQLVEANAKLELSHSVAEVVSPGLAGGLIQVMGAPVLLALDAVSYLFSAGSIAWIKHDEARPVREETVDSQSIPSIGREIREGVHLIFGDSTLRALAGCLGTVSLFNAMIDTLFLLYAVQILQLTPSLIGIIFGVGGVGFLVGALLQDRLSSRIPLHRSIIGGVIVFSLADLIVPLTRDVSSGTAVAMLIAAQFFFGLGITFFRVGQVSLRQTVTPDALQGRMNAAMSTVTSAAVPLGSLLGGWLGITIGVQATLVVAALGELCAILWLIRQR